MSARRVTAQVKREEAAVIVCQVLVHFGAGTGIKGQIFKSPNDIRPFVRRLLRSTIRNHKKIRWSYTPFRDTVCATARSHGALAAKKARGKPLTWDDIKVTLREVKKTTCPAPHAGGGLVCME